MNIHKCLAFRLTLFVLVAVLCNAYAANSSEGETIFERTFKLLHQGPPPPEVKSRAEIPYSNIEQKLDNFNDDDDRKWQMRYLANSEFYQNGGPFFIMVGGEWEVFSGHLVGGHLYDMAKEHHGYLFQTEHRYYGKSHPTSDITTETLEYLHVRQALADLAHFIITMKNFVPGALNSKVILAGGSYSATMVTWFKKLYPELAVGVWASSAPLLAKADFIEYKEIMGESIRKLGGENCYKRIENGIAELEEMFQTKRGAEAKAILKICDNFDEKNQLDIWTLFSEISEIFASVVQTHNDGQIQGVCQIIMRGDDDLGGIGNFLHLTNAPNKCIDITYQTYMKQFFDTSYTRNIMRQWIYQTCNEYGWYQTSGSPHQPFGTKFPLDLFLTICRDAYGPKFTRNFIYQQIEETNKLFGGWNPNVDNVYLTHGSLDPWHAMGIHDEENATVIPNYAHCKDFDSISSRDSPEMRASKEKLAETVRTWLSESTLL